MIASSTDVSIVEARGKRHCTSGTVSCIFRTPSSMTGSNPRTSCIRLPGMSSIVFLLASRPKKASASPRLIDGWTESRRGWPA